MEEILISFATALRERGIRVSPGETLDAVHALALGGMEGRKAVRALLQLTLVKNSPDLPAFEEEFDRFFSYVRQLPAGLDASEILNALIHIVEMEQLTVERSERPDEEGTSLLMDEEVTADDLEELSLSETEDDAGGTEVMVDLDGHRGKLDAPSPSGYDLQNLPSATFFQAGGATKPVAFTPEEISAMGEVVARMLVRIRKDVKRMKEKESRGRLHVVRTIQKNYRHGMVPFLLALRRKRKEKPRLVVFCDVSFSVSHATRFMLLLLHTLQNRVMDVHSFVFNRDLVEITDRLRNMPVNSLLEAIEKGEIVNLDDNSDYGHVFATFKQKHLEGMRGKPAILVLGDGRNNYQEANDWALEEIREKAGYLLWLTPEERETWIRGDCLMELYGTFCDRVEVVPNVEELSRIVEELFCTLYDHDDSRRWKRRRREPAVEEPFDFRNYYTKGNSGAPQLDPEVRRSW